MKFEANIPSYLKTGTGSFPVDGKGASKRKKPQNFYDQAQQGFEMSTTTEDMQTLYSPQGMTSKIEPNFFQAMQLNLEDIPAKQEMPQEMAKMPAQTSKVADETDKDEDIFIG